MNKAFREIGRFDEQPGGLNEREGGREEEREKRNSRRWLLI
jgi:hypothetical protein